MRLLVRTLLGVALVACSNRYVYVPATNTSAEIAGRPAADLAIPPEAPRGDVRVTSFGIASIRPQGTAEDTRVRALHARLIVANNSDKPWTLDTREARASIQGRAAVRAAYASADQGSLPIVTIPPGSRRTADLFFPLPGDVADAGDLPQFDAIWSVHTDARVVTERTPFDRIQLEPRAAYLYDQGGYAGIPAPMYDPDRPWDTRGGASRPPVYVDQPVPIEPER